MIIVIPLRANIVTEAWNNYTLNPRNCYSLPWRTWETHDEHFVFLEHFLLSKYGIQCHVKAYNDEEETLEDKLEVTLNQDNYIKMIMILS